MKSLLWLICMGLLAATPVSAQVYHYTDDKGRRIFVDRLSQVPPEYRDQLETRGRVLSEEEKLQQELLRADLLSEQARREQLRRVDLLLATMEVPVTIRGNMVYIPVRAVHGGRRVDSQLLLDTGASATVFHRASLTSLPLRPRPAGYAQVASGQRIPTESASFDRIEIGPFKLENQSALIIDFQGSGYDGLLGMDFLRQVEYRIDFDRSMIVWEPTRYKELQDARQMLLTTFED